MVNFEIALLAISVLNTCLLVLLLIRSSKFLKAQFRRLPHYMLRLLSRCVPKQKNLVVFGGCYGLGFMGNPKTLFIEAQKDKELDCVWLAKDSALVEELRSEGYKACHVHSKEGIIKAARAKVVVLDRSLKDDFDYHFLSGAISVHTWHGVGLKRSWFRNKRAFAGKAIMQKSLIKRFFDLHWAYTNMTKTNYAVATSEAVAAYYPETFHVPKENVLNLGQARNDVFYESNAKEELLSLPECFAQGKVIVYMPTHRDYGGRTQWGAGADASISGQIDYCKLSSMLEKYGYTFVIKQHFWNTTLPKIYQNARNIIDISKENYKIDTQVLLKHTDILITDYSSCYTDFLLLNRPVLFFCYDLLEYLQKWDLNFEYDEVTPGPKCFTSDQLIEELEKLLQGKDEFAEERERVKNIFYSKENQCPVAPKQVEFIRELTCGRRQRQGKGA